jgi:hypothetical protein
MRPNLMRRPPKYVQGFMAMTANKLSSRTRY